MAERRPIRVWVGVLVVILVVALLATCDRTRSLARAAIFGAGASEPAPPTPSESVPEAPGPDNTVRELPPGYPKEPEEGDEEDDQ